MVLNSYIYVASKWYKMLLVEKKNLKKFWLVITQRTIMWNLQLNNETLAEKDEKCTH